MVREKLSVNLSKNLQEVFEAFPLEFLWINSENRFTWDIFTASLLLKKKFSFRGATFTNLLKIVKFILISFYFFRLILSIIKQVNIFNLKLLSFSFKYKTKNNRKEKKEEKSFKGYNLHKMYHPRIINKHWYSLFRDKTHSFVSEYTGILSEADICSETFLILVPRFRIQSCEFWTFTGFPDTFLLVRFHWFHFVIYMLPCNKKGYSRIVDSSN